MNHPSNVFVSAVVIVDKNSVGCSDLVKELSKILRKKYSNYEVLVVDNGLAVEELNSLKLILPKVSCIRIIRLSQEYPIDTALFAGVEASIGDFIVTLYNHDNIVLVPDFVKAAHSDDIVQGVATNLKRKSIFQEQGAKLFYWYCRRYLNLDIPNGSTYYLCINRTAANAMTRSGRYNRHIRHMAKRIGFSASVMKYDLPEEGRHYNTASGISQIYQAVDLISNYSSHPLRVLSYFGIFAGLMNIIYAAYVVLINLSQHEIAKGWTTLSLQSSFMFFVLFMILAVFAEYIGKILNETQNEPPYHLMQELSSTVSVADETRRNIQNS